jgi:hypothetical protein
MRAKARGFDGTQTIDTKTTMIARKCQLCKMEVVCISGLLNKEESSMLSSSGTAPPYWKPLIWARSLLKKARAEERIKGDAELSHIMSELGEFRGKCGKTLQVDSIGIPLAYSQVCKPQNTDANFLQTEYY